ncbi:TetR family transcriptional regulator [Bifidobacterium animalis subsp. lactis]|uniref:TetR/AcrR family transcriptional regulator n=1 Tax=Bifidobacterium animalis TaxID=28025 RepID=UPI001020760B|nr:TetR/AcrR family transcriptional regulator [Bifidobacterium animalis]RYM92319.1 TetR family transcriptional regulator [Bifidobacterium animalis subsp. lactis]RYM92434.1 TetR family transcriptional regulator [Bifidobacterium animalis subsp. lactis]RYN12745.1 TetR family transcriptional regulator [Bifidobacterium animalis subsp. animalis]
MNTQVTSREAMLAAARDIVRTQGLQAISMRKLAQKCGISVGSVYNYFPSKSDLLSACVQSVWHDIFDPSHNTIEFGSFPDCVRWIFERLELGNRSYPGFLTLHSMSFLGERRNDGESLMEGIWNHMRHAMVEVLEHDSRVNDAVFTAHFTREQFVELIFSLVISAIVRHDFDAEPVVQMVERVIY